MRVSRIVSNYRRPAGRVRARRRIKHITKYRVTSFGALDHAVVRTLFICETYVSFYLYRFERPRRPHRLTHAAAPTEPANRSCNQY